jgi:hypothetical protein
MAADVSFGDENEPHKLAVSADAAQPVDAPQSDQLSDQLARNYLSKLLTNIKIMLTYATNNGIALPDDLRPKIDELLTHPDISIDELSTRPHLWARAGFSRGRAFLEKGSREG